jgi:hypothetical protein
VELNTPEQQVEVFPAHIEGFSEIRERKVDV